MTLDDTEVESESDLRRRAAWLLVMLAVVAVLLVIVISALVTADGGGGSGGNHPGALDSVANSPTTQSHKPRHTGTAPAKQRTGSRTATSPAPSGRTSCPTSAPCILAGDVGNGIQAINDYRTAHGQPAVPGTVTPQAQNCAVRNGNDCSGGWAETELATADGAEAVQKILPFARLLDPNMKSVEVGWAYDPGARLYYFAIIRND